MPATPRHASRLLPSPFSRWGLLAGAAALALAGCGGDMGYGGGDFGATPGGVKDLSLARELIAAGQIPPAAALPVEGMFAEHDLGLTGAPCNDTLCLRAAPGVAPGADGEPRGWVQVGLSSNVDPDIFVRPPTTFIFAVDVSGSMGWGGGSESYPTPGWLSREVLRDMVEVVDGADQVAVVTYGSRVSVPLDLTSGADHAALREIIDGLDTAGSTNMEAGLRKAYELGREARAAGRTNVRVMLFTDVQPNVGATSPTEFDRIVGDGALDGVHITVLALGLGVGAEVLEAMAHVRGANAFSLQKVEHVSDFMTDEYPWFTTPIAYDLSVGLAPAAGLAVDQPYGFPAGFEAEPTMTVSTVFLSKRRGALLVSLRETQSGALDDLAATVDLGFVNPSGVARTSTLRVDRAGAPLDERGHWYAQPTVARTTALALLVSGMHDAADVYASSPAQAEQIMAAAAERFTADAAAIDAPDVTAEVELADAMLRLIEERAPQGTLYGP